MRTEHRTIANGQESKFTRYTADGPTTRTTNKNTKTVVGAQNGHTHGYSADNIVRCVGGSVTAKNFRKMQCHALTGRRVVPESTEYIYISFGVWILVNWRLLLVLS